MVTLCQVDILCGFLSFVYEISTVIIIFTLHISKVMPGKAK